MKIRITLTVEIDRDDWSHEYNVHPDEVRADVRRYVLNCISEAEAPIIGVGAR